MKSSAFRGDPYGHLTNQLAHGVLGIAIATVATAAGLHWAAQPFAAALLYWLAVEVVGQRLTLLLDSLADAGHVFCGASLAAALALSPVAACGVLAVWGAWLALGYWVSARA